MTPKRAIRCPYCVEEGVFKMMTLGKVGFFCGSCGHTVLPSQPDYKCSCEKCKNLPRPTQIPAHW